MVLNFGELGHFCLGSLHHAEDASTYFSWCRDWCCLYMNKVLVFTNAAMLLHSIWNANDVFLDLMKWSFYMVYVVLNQVYSHCLSCYVQYLSRFLGFYQVYLDRWSHLLWSTRSFMLNKFKKTSYPYWFENILITRLLIYIENTKVNYIDTKRVCLVGNMRELHSK